MGTWEGGTALPGGGLLADAAGILAGPGNSAPRFSDNAG